MKNPDAYGFYRVHDLKFYSKFEAISCMEKTGVHLHWDFSEEIYSSYNWKQEPKESLTELYRRRAQQLRDQYDHLVLFFSGGADSNNILNSFVNNDIRLDEVVSMVNYDATGNRLNNMNAEIFNVAAQKIKEVQETHSYLKHTIVDICQRTSDWWENPLTSDWMYYINNAINPSNVAKTNYLDMSPEWQKMTHQGKKIGFIYGIDKPRVHQCEDGTYIFRFIDFIDSAVAARQQSLNREWDNPELFYWTPDMPEIVIKQAHIIKNYLKIANKNDMWLSPEKSDLAYKLINGQKFWLSTAGIHTLIYPNWKWVPFTFKPISPVFGHRDTWFHNLNKLNPDPGYQRYKNGLHKRFQVTPDYWKNDPNDLSKGYKLSWSKEYNLGR